LDQDYKIEHTSEHRAKFRADQSTELGDYTRKKEGKKENKCQQNISLPENYCFRAD